MARAASFAGKTAIITGGASGIGRAMGAELVARGAAVVLADIEGDAAVDAAEVITAAAGRPGAAVGRSLDVRIADAVEDLVAEVVARDGALDLMFNNAGMSIGGPTEELTEQHWDRIIDVNLRGVVNGVLAAYPRMIEQGHGHIVNTASAAGLVAPPLVVAYATTKHAVVGLSTGLRPEAALHGVAVTVLCPGAVDTAILDRPTPDDLPARASVEVTARQYLTKLHQKLMDPDRFARQALDAVARNKGIVIVPGSARVVPFVYAVSPALVERVWRVGTAVVMRDLVHPADGQNAERASSPRPRWSGSRWGRPPTGA